MTTPPQPSGETATPIADALDREVKAIVAIANERIATLEHALAAANERTCGELSCEECNARFAAMQSRAEAAERHDRENTHALADAQLIVDNLKAWKESALAVEREWDAQAVAKMLGVPLSQSCRAGINEKVPLLIAKLAEAEKRATEAERDTARLDWLDSEGFPKAGTYPVAALVVKAGYDRNSSEWVNIATSARAAIDTAQSSGGKVGT